MSELQPVIIQSDGDYVRCSLGELYLKEEVDKVIAELEESHKTEVKELLHLIRDKENNFNRAFDSEEKEIRYHKYKRCLAMARWCESNNISLYSVVENNLWKYTSNYWLRWRNKWLELAEKLKPNNSTAQSAKEKNHG